MPRRRKRKYAVKGTKDFLIYAAALGALGIWCVADGWFPRGQVIKKHPKTIELYFNSDAVIDQVHLLSGDPVRKGAKIITLRADSETKAELEAAEKEFREARKSGSTVRLREIEQRHQKAYAEYEKKCIVKMPEKHEGYEVHDRNSVLQKLTHTRPGVVARKGELAAVVKMNDGFYTFNKTSAVLSLGAALFFLVFHWVANKE